MPIYPYFCENCQKEFEVIAKTFHESTNHETCPICGSDDTRRLLSTFGGYKINGDNSASYTPKNAGSMNRKPSC